MAANPPRAKSYRPLLLTLAILFAAATIVYSAGWMYYSSRGGAPVEVGMDTEQVATGLRVKDVYPDSPALRAGLRWPWASRSQTACCARSVIDSTRRGGAKSSGEPPALQKLCPRKAATTKARAGLQRGVTLRARADVNADDRFTMVLHGVEAVLAEQQGQLVFALGVKTAVTFRTSREGRAFAQFASMNFSTNFKGGHENSPTGYRGTRDARKRRVADAEGKRVTGGVGGANA